MRGLTPERVARVVAGWAWLYTRQGCRPPGAERRTEGELAADVHDQIAHERAAGVDERRIALTLASRLLRAASPADAAWRACNASPRTDLPARRRLRDLRNSLFLLWLLAAVGVIGVEGDPADQMYLALLALGLLGAVTVRFRARGMARVPTAMALALAPIAVVALLAGRADAPASSIPELLGLNLMFGLLFAGSAILFRHAGRRSQAPAPR